MKTNRPALPSEEHCTGCGACSNICPHGAIKMLPDQEGFIQPDVDMGLCISCQKCVTICPVLHPQYNNRMIDSCYAMWADDEIRAKTSTAGMFFLAAQKTIQTGGIVYGAAWDKNWQVHHIGIESEEELPLLLGSKYIQSNIEKNYQEVKLNLEKKRPVLFSGCPCQIAGLYSFLDGIEYPTLITIEVICHGVASPKALHKYLIDNFKDKKIKNIFFRDKTLYKWSVNTTIYFENSETYHENSNEDPFIKAFNPCLIMRRACSNCPFAKLPRQADMSIGDFWGINSTDKTWDDRNGTAVVLINNEKGETLWDVLKPSYQRWEKFPLEEALKINRTIQAPFRRNPGRKHFFMSMKLKPFNQLVEASLKHNYDIGIVGLWYGINYGSILTYFALYQLLKELGYDSVMLPKPNSLWKEKFNQPTSIAQKFIWENCNVLLPFQTQDSYRTVNDQCKDFVLGSDVVWNYKICGQYTDQFFFLDWVESGHKKIAYASSFGDSLTDNLPYNEKSKYYLKQFDAISIRELSGVEYAIQHCERDDIVQVLDPVFVCSPSIYDQIIGESNLNEESPFVFSYCLNGNMASKKKEMVRLACDYFGANSRFCGNPNTPTDSKTIYGEQILPVINVEDWLYYMKNCSCFIGDSYHALCFSLIFHKPFIMIFGGKSASSNFRFDSLLKLVGLDNRLLGAAGDPKEYSYLLKEEIDWDYVDKCISIEREKSLKWLDAALKKESAMPTGIDYIRDSEKRKLSEYGRQLFKLNQSLEEQQNIIDALINRLDSESSENSN